MNDVETRCASCGEIAKPTDRDVADVPDGCEVSVREALALNAGVVKVYGRVCERCFELVGRLQRADRQWRRLRDELASICRGRPPPDGSRVHGADAEAETRASPEIKTEAADDAAFSPMRFSDSDDEPLYRAKTKSERPDDETAPDDRKKKKERGKSKKSVDESNDQVGYLTRKLSVGGVTVKKVPYASRAKSNAAEAPGTIRTFRLALEKEADSSEKRKYTKKERVVCPECPAAFTSTQRLQLHMAKHDETRGPYICEICGAEYKHKKACDIHVNMHKGVSPWKCSQCGKIFPSKGALSRHEAIHTGTPNYQCDLCGKSFIHTSSFKMHKLSHSGVKPHTCNKCGLSLMTKSHLKRHQRVHSGEKRHECESCGKKFSERYNLYAHQKSHQYSSSKPQQRSSLETSSSGARVSKIYNCTLCPSTFIRRLLLEKHLQTAHALVSETKFKHPRNTMSKLMKMQTQMVAIDQTLVKPEVILLEAQQSETVRSPKENQSLPIPSTIIELKNETPYTSTSEEKPNIHESQSQNEPINGTPHPWQHVNYQLANDYPLKMHGVDYAGYLNRQ